MPTSEATMHWRQARAADATALCDIYNHYVKHTHVTFEEMPVMPDEMAQRLAEITQAGNPWLVHEDSDGILGFAYASPWKSRCAYRYSRETTVYLSPQAQGRGIGTQLYRALISELSKQRLHSLLGGIALPNDASIALHEKLGFKQVARFEQVGFKFDRWIDVGYWQLLL